MQVQRKIIDVHDTRVVLELPQSFVNHRVEFIALTMDEPSPPQPQHPVRRRPHPDLVGKGRTLGDIVSPIVDPADFSDPL